MHTESTTAPATWPRSSSPESSANSAVQPSFTHFQPTQEAASDILIALLDPDETLAEIAKRFHTTIDALADWLESPPVVKRIDTIKRVTASRAELIAISNQRMALSALISILEAHRDDELNLPVNNQSLKAVAQRDRRRATARLAASQLIRLAGPGGTGVPPVLSAQGPYDTSPRPRRTPTTHQSHISQSQAGRLCHKDHQTTSPPASDSSPTSSPPPQRNTTPSTGGQTASGTQVIFCALPRDPAVSFASTDHETG